MALFEGNKAETKTLIPVIEQFKTRHGINELVVVADAGMLSADNLNGLEDAGCRFIVASRQSHVPYDLGDHSERHDNYTPRRLHDRDHPRHGYWLAATHPPGGISLSLKRHKLQLPFQTSGFAARRG